MKKIILLTAALCLSAAATAEVKIYGELKSGIEASRTKIGGERLNHTQISDFGNHIGIRGSHPIGGKDTPNQIIWQWEQNAPSASDKRSGSLRQEWRERKQRGESYIGLGSR